MKLDSTSLQCEAHSNSETKELLILPKALAQERQRTSEGGSRNNLEKRIWRRKEEAQCLEQGCHATTSNTQSSRPLAPAGELFPPQPATRSTDSNKIHQIATAATRNAPTPPMAHADETRKLVTKVPKSLLATLRSNCDAKASISLLGRIHGKHPGLKALTAWARETLHPTLELLSLKTNNVFEVTFAKPEGRLHTLNQTELVCDSSAIHFSSWQPHFDPNNPRETDRHDHPVWVQIVDLCQVLREDSFLQIIGEQIG